MSEWLGIDVGGANLKGADGQGRAVSHPFALWRDPRQLRERLTALIQEFDWPSDAGLALTMTGELADCFATKAEGVTHIVRAAVLAATGRPIRVATSDDCWLTTDEAIESPPRVAAANWRLLARYGARLLGEISGLVIDVGSTTVDVIPVNEQRVVSLGANDTERLLANELVYTGVRRTPVCALLDRLPYRGKLCPVMAELFATADDAWLVLGESTTSESCDTADGQPRSKEFACSRLARCIGADRETFTMDDAHQAAEAIAAAQVELVATALRIHTERYALQSVLLSGEGEFLARRAIEQAGLACPLIRLSETIGQEPSRCAPAHAAAVLANKELG